MGSKRKMNNGLNKLQTNSGLDVVNDLSLSFDNQQDLFKFFVNRLLVATFDRCGDAMFDMALNNICFQGS